MQLRRRIAELEDAQGSEAKVTGAEQEEEDVAKKAPLFLKV